MRSDEAQEVLPEENEGKDVKKEGEEAQDGEASSSPPLLSLRRLAGDGTTEYALTLRNFPHYRPDPHIVWCSPDQYAFIRTMGSLQEMLLNIFDHQVIREVCNAPDTYGVRALYDAITTTFLREFEPTHYQELLTRVEHLISYYDALPYNQRSRHFRNYGGIFSHGYEYIQVEWEPYCYLVYAMLVAPLMKFERRGFFTPETFALAQAHLNQARTLHQLIPYVPGLPFDAAYDHVRQYLHSLQWF